MSEAGRLVSGIHSCGVMKYFMVKYDIQENGCDILEPIYNGGVGGVDEESVNSVGDMNA